MQYPDGTAKKQKYGKKNGIKMNIFKRKKKTNPAPEETGEEFDVRHYTWHDFIERFSPILKPHWLKIVFGMTGVALVGIAVAVQPLLPKYVIDTAIPEKSLLKAGIAAILFVIVQFSRMGIWLVAYRAILQIQQIFIFELRSKSFHHLQKLCLSFHSRFSSGFLYERIFGSSIGTLGGFIVTMMQGIALNISGLFFSMIFCIWISWQLTLVILVGAIFYVWTAKRLAPRIYQRNKVAMQQAMKVTELIMDRLHGHKTIQAYSMENVVQKDFDHKVWDAQMKWMDSYMENIRFSMISEGIGYILTACVVFGGAFLILNLDTPIGVLVAFIGYQVQLIGVINSLTNIYSQFTSTRVAFDQLFTILDTHSDVEDLQGKEPIPAKPERLEFSDVTFGYTDEKTVLKNVSFSIERGKTVALVGRSGCGKTTATNVLLRFYDPAGGALKLDNTDIRKLPLHEYRKQFGVVLQDPYLFDDTIRSNLAMANPDATEAEMIEALKNAVAWDFVQELKGGLDFKVGEGGRRLSGGQRQRLAVARCLLLKSNFVILDEATSALDPESEAILQSSFRALSKDRGMLIIAHRLNTLRFADKIVVMDAGKVVEEGTYDELCR